MSSLQSQALNNERHKNKKASGLSTHWLPVVRSALANDQNVVRLAACFLVIA